MSASDQMAWRLRSSKFRHVFGSPAKKEQCYECIKITKNAHDSNFCAVNPKFLAVVIESSGGGAFVVLPIERVGRVDTNSAKVCGHSGPVLDIKWNPFNDNLIASCSDDATIKLWQIPEGGLKGNLTEWLVDLHGHQRRVGYLEWHPTAENILLSAGYDFNCILWNTETAEPINIISVHNDTIFSISWSRDGSLFATTSKDKKIRVIDPRDGAVVAEASGHQGSKSSKVVFLGNKNRLFTTGFSRMSERQYAIWDIKNLTKPLKMECIDSSSGGMFPFYDHDTNIVFLAGKGDGNIRYYELVPDAPYIHYLAQYQSGSPQRGLGVMPKRGVDPLRCEIVRFYKLHTVKGMCEPVAMIVPRKSEMFQEDIFPPTASACPSLSADEWISGQNREPILVSLKDRQILPAPKCSSVARAVLQPKVTQNGSGPAHRPAVTTPASKHKDRRKSTESSGLASARPPSSAHARPPSPKPTPCARNGTVSQMRNKFSKKDGALSHSPTITTYKAVKRGASTNENAAVTTGTSNKRSADSAAMRTGTAVPPDKLPASVKNIKKLSSTKDEGIEEDNKSAGSDADKVTVFETKRTVATSQHTTRMTNTNQPIRVDKKVWRSSYTNATSNDISSTDIVPRTDPERGLSPTAPPPHQGSLASVLGGRRSDEVWQETNRESQLPSKAATRMDSVESRADIVFDTSLVNRKSSQVSRREMVSSSSVTSDAFFTPPSSPYFVTSPILADSGRKNTIGQDLPWQENPIYGNDSVTPAPRTNRPPSVDTSALDDILHAAQASVPQTIGGRHSSRLNSDGSPAPTRSTLEEHHKAQSIHSQTKSMENLTAGPLEVAQVDKHSANVPAVKSQENLMFVDDDSDEEAEWSNMLTGISTDAPDNTLIKPSKLRASLRSRRERSSFRESALTRADSTPVRSKATRDYGDPESYRKGVLRRPPLRARHTFQNGDIVLPALKSDVVVQPTTPAAVASTRHRSDPKVLEINNNLKSRTRSETNGANYVALASVSLQQGKPANTGFPPRSSTSRNQSDQRRYVFSRSSEEPNSTAEPQTKVDQFTFSMDSAVTPTARSDTSITSNKPGVFRSPPATTTSAKALSIDPMVSQVSVNGLDRGHSVPAAAVTDGPPDVDGRYVTKVWSTYAPSGESVGDYEVPVSLTNGLPGTEEELRKAYFHQLEEIKSLKEHISVKDKRIRQLEDELRHLRTDSGLASAESNC